MSRLRLLSRLEEQWEGCKRCALSRSRTRVVHWRGSPGGRLFIIGDAPGPDEDDEGLPFVGGAGHLLDLILKRSGIGNEDVCMTNLVCCRPPGSRAPDVDEVKECSPRLQATLRIVRPGAVLLMGSEAAKRSGAHSVAVSRGQETSMDLLCYDGKIRSWPAVVTWSPGYMLRSGGQNGSPFHDALKDVALAWKLSQGQKFS